MPQRSLHSHSCVKELERCTNVASSFTIVLGSRQNGLLIGSGFSFPALFLVLTHPVLFFSIHSLVDINRSRNFLGHLLHSQFPTHSGNNVILQAPLILECSGNFSIPGLLGHVLLTFHLQVCYPNW